MAMQMWSPEVTSDFFTSDLNMWSPTPSEHFDITNDTFYTATTQPLFHNYYHESRNYYHEPVYYPATCMLCGLPHSETLTTVTLATTCHPAVTPAPIVDISTLPASPIEEKPRHRQHRKQWMKRIKLWIRGFLQHIIHKFLQDRPIYPSHKAFT